MLPSISESSVNLLPLDTDGVNGAGSKPPIIPRITSTSKQLGDHLTLSGYSFLDTLAEIASQSSPLRSKLVKTTDMSLRSRPRASSEPWLSSFITSQMEEQSSIYNASGGSNGGGRHRSDSISSNASYDDDLSSEREREPESSATLPQMLAKYSSIYNKNGRIGIYTRAERNDMISRFHEKRKRRVWKKKIRYHCRKNLADSRIRVKGRFVKCADDIARIEAEAGAGRKGDSKPSAAGDLISSADLGIKKEPSPTMDGHFDEEDEEDDEDGVGGLVSRKGVVVKEEDGEADREQEEQETDPELRGGRTTRKRMRRHSIAY